MRYKIRYDTTFFTLQFANDQNVIVKLQANVEYMAI